jgi:hypothetical protein
MFSLSSALTAQLKQSGLSYQDLLEQEKKGFVGERRNLKNAMVAQIAAGEKEFIASARAIKKVVDFLEKR